jgi:hypothetical protein
MITANILKRGRIMEEIKKIIAKAVYGRGTQPFSKSIHIGTYEKKKPTEILGCIITDAEVLGYSYEGEAENGKTVRANGKFDVHLWYGLGGDTKVTRLTTKFSDIVTVHAQGAGKYSDEEVRAWIERAPACTKTAITDGPEGPGITVQTEYELGAEIIGQTSLNVKVINPDNAVEELQEIPMENEEILDEFEDD